MKKAIITVDLGFGDSGKGTIVDFLVRDRDAAAVVRYNGGPQAGHRVVAPDGREHIFAQFGSGTFVDDVRTHLGPQVLVNPFNAFAEEEHLLELGIEDAFDRLSVDPLCPVITPFQIAANRIRELARGSGRHGSCGQGVGETRQDEIEYGPAAVLRAGQLAAEAKVRRVLESIRERKRAEMDELLSGIEITPAIAKERAVFYSPDAIPSCIETYRSFAAATTVTETSALRHLDRPIVFEGAQGVLLDERYGFYPYTTWTDTTDRNARKIANDLGLTIETIGITRAYATRHGAGPFPSESPRLTSLLPDATNTHDPWQRHFRVGYLDLVLLEYAIQVCLKVDGIALTCLDRIAGLEDWCCCSSYSYRGFQPIDENVFGTIDEREIATIRQPWHPSPERMGDLTRRLMVDVEPITEPLAPEEDAYAELIADALWLPVVITSHGPSAEDKKVMALKSA